MKTAHILFYSLLAILITACGTTSVPTTATAPANSLPRQLATVFISPTPNEQERQATRSIVTFATVEPTATLEPTRTPYIGVFVGDSVGLAEDIPVFNPTLYAGTLIANQPTATVSTCDIMTDEIFGTSWASVPLISSGLGCAGEPSSTVNGVSQIFERGAMYYAPSGDFWVLAPGGSTGGQYWHTTQVPLVEAGNYVAPEGLFVPAQGFGSIWRANGDIRESIGYARSGEQAIRFTLQRFIGGALIRDESAGQVFVLVGSVANGIVYGPF